MPNGYEYRPRQSKEVREKVDAFLNRLGVTNINRSQLNNFLVGVGVTCLNKSLDAVTDELKKKGIASEFRQGFLELLQ